MLETGCRPQQARHLLGAEHNRESARIRNANELAGQVWSVDRVGEEEAQCGHSAVHRRGVHTEFGLMDLEPAHVLGRRRGRRAPEERHKAGDDAEVVFAGLLGEPAHRHVLDQTLTQAVAGRCRRESVHGELLSS